MSLNPFLDAVRAGTHPIQAWVWNPSPLSTEIIARSGFDSIGFDLQHGAVDFSDLYSLFAIASAHGVTPMVRIPSNDPGWISRVLDAGAYGVICPDVRSAAEAEAFVRACRYAPEGERGFGPVRPAMGAPGSRAVSTGYDMAAQNAAVMVIVQIESPEGLAAVGEIVAVAGVDGVFPGPVDYSVLTTGEVLFDYGDERLGPPMKAIVDACHDAGKFVGLPAIVPEHVGLFMEMGVDWIQIGNDVAWITAAARQTVASAREAIAAAGS
ncbi:MAG: aldolase/citrate lyase family protein [Acidimicrobiales bacterium]